jgi:hypothetical protein
MGDLSGKTLPPSASDERVRDFELRRTFNIDMTQTRAAQERPIVCSERPQTEAMIAPMTQIGLQIFSRRSTSPNPPKKSRYLAIKVELHKISQILAP